MTLLIITGHIDHPDVARALSDALFSGQTVTVSRAPPTAVFAESMPIAWLKEMDDWHLRKSFLTSLQARYAFPQSHPTSRSSYRPDRPVVRSLRSVNRNR